MRVADQDYILALHNGARVVNYATFTFADGTTKNLQPSDFRVTGNTYTDKTTDSSAFSVGSFIGKTANICIDNSDGRFDNYDFYMSRFILKESIAIREGTSVTVKHVVIGEFTVVTDYTPGKVISFSAVDATYKFDKPHNLTGSKTFKQIIQQACTQCLGSQTFDGTGNFSLYNTLVDTSKLDAKVTWRQVVSYVAIACGYNAYIDTTGLLKFKWYDTSVWSSDDLDGGTFRTTTTPYSDGDNADGGDFTFSEVDNYDGGLFTDTQNYHLIQTYKNFQIGTYDISITGVRVINGETVVESSSTHTYGYSYVIEVKDNPLCVGIESTIAGHLANKLLDFTFRIFSCDVLCDPLIEAGDMALVVDRRGIEHRTLINSVEYSTGGYTKIACQAESIIRQQSSYTSEAAKAMTEANRHTDDTLSSYDESVQRMNRLSQNSSGLYTARVKQQDGSYIYYTSDHAITYNSDGSAKFTVGSFVAKDSGSGYFYSTSAGLTDATTTWVGGIDRNGNAVLNTLSVYGLVADWIRTGTLDAELIDVINLNASNIVTGQMSADRILGGSLFMSGDMGGFIACCDPNSLMINGTGNYTYSWYISYSFTQELGRFIVSVDLSNIVSPSTANFQYNIYWTNDNGVHWYFADSGTLKAKANRIPYAIPVQSTNANIYYRLTILNTANNDFDVDGLIYKANTTIDSDGIITNNLTALDGCSFGDLQVGKKTSGLFNTEVTYIYAGGYKQMFYGEWDSLSASYYNTIYFSPFYDGWKSVSTVDIMLKFYSYDPDSHNMTEICKVTLYKWNGSSWVSQGYRRYNQDGVEMDDKDSYFEDFDVTDNSIYKLKIKIIKKTWLEDYVLDIYAQPLHSLEIDPDETTGTFRGSLTGSANLYGLTVNDITIDQSNEIVYEDEDTSAKYRISKNGFYSQRAGSYGAYIRMENNVYPQLIITAAGSSGSYPEEISIHTQSPNIYVADDNTEYISISTTQMNLHASNSDYAKFLGYGHGELYSYYNGSAYEIQWTSSDRRNKENIVDLDTELSKKLIDATEPKKFKYKNSEGTHYGMIAQEAREVLDSLGETDAMLEHGIPAEDDSDPRNITYQEYIPHLINYVKELRDEIDSLKEEIKILKGEK